MSTVIVDLSQRVKAWLLQREGWIEQGGIDRLTLCENWHSA